MRNIDISHFAQSLSPIDKLWQSDLINQPGALCEAAIAIIYKISHII